MFISLHHVNTTHAWIDPVGSKTLGRKLNFKLWFQINRNRISLPYLSVPVSNNTIFSIKNCHNQTVCTLFMVGHGLFPSFFRLCFSLLKIVVSFCVNTLRILVPNLFKYLALNWKVKHNFSAFWSFFWTSVIINISCVSLFTKLICSVAKSQVPSYLATDLPRSSILCLSDSMMAAMSERNKWTSYDERNHSKQFF